MMNKDFMWECGDEVLIKEDPVETKTIDQIRVVRVAGTDKIRIELCEARYFCNADDDLVFLTIPVVLDREEMEKHDTKTDWSKTLHVNKK